MAEETRTTRSIYLYGLLVVVCVVLALAALLIPSISRAVSPPPKPGDIATVDYRAPEPITYISEVLTEEKRQQASDAVQPIFTSADTGVARTQLNRLRNTLDYISTVRSDQYASQTQKQEDLVALSDIQLDAETASTILGLTEDRWQSIQQESIAVLERIMSSPIREDNLASTQNRVPNLVSLQLPESQADIASELATAFVAPNSEFSEELTQSARDQAREEVVPVSRSFAVGQTIALRGTVLDEADLEALEQLRLIQPEPKWHNLLSAVALVLLVAVIVAVYINRHPALALQFGRSVVIIAALFLVTLFSARFTIPSHAVLPYAFPVAAYSLTIAALFGPELSMVTTLPLAILVAFGLPNALDLTLYYSLGGIFGTLALGKARRIVSFFKAGAAVVVAGIVVIVAYRLPLPTSDIVGIATLAGASVLNGLASASIALLLQFLLSQILGMTAPMQLMDLTRPDQPLLQRLLNNAPGTYQHSLQVANLSEQAAERIDADPLLTRVGALYHDIGKSRNPIFFIENQVEGYPNPHDTLDPATSAAVIIRHVPDGLELAKKYRLPSRIKDFIAEHHGTMVTQYQYTNSVKEADGDEEAVDIGQFTYPGPRPQSKETAIVMLADGCEARVRAEKPKESNELKKIIREVIDFRVANDQLANTDLTLRELEVIGDSFAATLKGAYHPRIEYPKLGTHEPAEQAQAAQLTASSEPVTTPIAPRPVEDDEVVDISIEPPLDLPVDIDSSSSVN